MVEVVALFYVEVSSADLARILRYLFANTANNYTFDTTLVETIFSSLARKGLVTCENGRVGCVAEFIEIACRNSVQQRRVKTIKDAITLFLNNRAPVWGSQTFASYYSPVRAFRLELFNGLLRCPADDNLNFIESDYQAALKQFPLLAAVVGPFEPEWFSCLAIETQVRMLSLAHKFSMILFADFTDLFAYFRDPRWLKSDIFRSYGAVPMAEHLLLCGDFDGALTYADNATSCEALGIVATIHLLQGSRGALKQYQAALKALRKQVSRKTATFGGLADFFYLLALLREPSPAHLVEAEALIQNSQRQVTFFGPVYRQMTELLNARTSGKHNNKLFAEAVKGAQTPLHKWLAIFSMAWLAGLDQAMVPSLNRVIEKATTAGFLWPLNETLAMKLDLKCGISADEKQMLSDWHKLELLPLGQLLEPKAQWEIVIDALRNVVVPDAESVESDKMLIWDMLLISDGQKVLRFELTPREKTRLKSGKWSSGKIVELSRFSSEGADFPDFYTSQDKGIIQALQKVKFALMYLNDAESWQVFPQLIGHPHVYAKSGDEEQLQIARGEPMLLLDQHEDKLRLTFQPEFSGEKVVVLHESGNFLRVYEFSEQQMKAGTLLQTENQFPAVARDKVLGTVAMLTSKMPVHSTIEGAQQFTSIETVACREELYILLTPEGAGLKVKACVKPFGSSGPVFKPGHGLLDVYADIDGEKLHTRRDHDGETARLGALASLVPLLEGIDEPGFDDFFSTAEEALELLLQLGNAKEIIVEWPAEKKIRKVTSVSASSLRLKVDSRQDWFALEGSLQVDDELVIDLQQLLTQYSESGGRFVELGEGQFIALTEEFRRRLNDIKSFTETVAGQTRFHKLAIPVLNEAFADLPDVIFDQKWRKALQRLEAADKMEFKVPSTLTAELREYQVEAFQWLCRMNYLEMGACLADDMGLGKTIEALALILHKSSTGPTLVVAPTSVCMNWFNETRRFAPTMNPIIFAQSQRRDVIEKLGPFDLIICSYGIMQNEISMLSEVDWATVVLDEAQAIKNMATNRSHAAMALNGRFKMIMTGTPIENHLGELWNLFRFINNGLLGSLESFNSRFANLIQNKNDKIAQLRLKKLIQPFVLRRTKSQVLQDLPPRTEITLHVDLSSDEAALYESMRRSAVAKIDGAEVAAGHKHMMILAELMKLRRLCCNPSLVAPDLNLTSSKLSLLETVVDELLENRHKALIFSQFVDHLAIVRQLFDKKKIAYQYLDGSTTTKNRSKAIDAFQAGDGDLFLISLKAGGLGLNLTAADYVIHLDPWWNPAVEDQASDRAHRIGQTRPVTIYRLITSKTIEEKIVDLHHRKRDLADGLLEGSDMAGKISSNDLLDLLKETSFV